MLKGKKYKKEKKSDTLCLKKYRPVSLLPICGKRLQRLMFKFLGFLLKANRFPQFPI